MNLDTFSKPIQNFYHGPIFSDFQRGEQFWDKISNVKGVQRTRDDNQMTTRLYLLESSMFTEISGDIWNCVSDVKFLIT